MALTFSGQASYGNLRKTLNHDHPWHKSLWGRFTDPCEGVVSSHPFSAVTLTPFSVCRQRVLGKPGSKPKEQTLVCSICWCPWCKRPSKAKVKPPTGSHGADVAGMGWACPALAGPSHRCPPVSPPPGAHFPGLLSLRSVPWLSRGSPLLPGCALEAWAPLPTGSCTFAPRPAATCSHLPSRPQLHLPPPPLLPLLSSFPQPAQNDCSVLHIRVMRQTRPLASRASWQSGWTDLIGG